MHDGSPDTKLRDLNYDCIAEIFSHLDLPTFMRCRRICKEFYAASIRTRGICASQQNIVDILKLIVPDDPSMVLRCVSRITDPDDDLLCCVAARNRHRGDALRLLKWLRDPKARADGSVCGWSYRTVECAVKNTNQDESLRVLKWLRDPDAHAGRSICTGSNRVCNWAALNGHLDVLKWLRDPDSHRDASPDGGVCGWSTITFDFAVENGCLGILKWLRDPTARADGSICPWSSSACVTAALKGDLGVLKWLRDPSARADGSVCKMPFDMHDIASSHDHHHIVEWLEKNGCFPPR